MRKSLILLLTFLLLLPLMVSADGIIEVDRQTDIPSFLGYVQDRIIVVMKPESSKLKFNLSASSTMHIGDAAFDAISDKYAVSKIEKQFQGTNSDSFSKTAELAKYHKISFNDGTLDEVVAAYENNPLVEKVERIGIHAMYATPNDTYYNQYQWYHNQTNNSDINSPEAWNVQTGNTAITLAILDSGTRYFHPDLGGANASISNPNGSRGNMWINNAELNGSAGVDDDNNGYVDDWIGYDFVTNGSNCWSGEDCNTKDNDPRDFNGHGTHTAGIIGMITNDGYGMAGVAGGWSGGTQQVVGNGIKVMPLRMGYSYNYFGQEYGIVLMDAAAEAFYYAADNGAKIASCSWGSSNTGGIGAAATYFTNNGGLIFVAAGNAGDQVAGYLNSRSDCISVAATDQNDAAATFTTYGNWVDISAPGVGIYSTYHDHNSPNTITWASLDGTSMACPMAAGVAGLIWSQNPSWSASQVENQLYSSADNIDASLSATYIGKMGAGRINAFAAVNTGTPAPSANFNGTPTSGCAPLAVSFTDASTGSITSWAWDFGDGGTSTSQNPSYTYSVAGTYNVSLTVTGPGGSNTMARNNYVTANGGPTASFSGSPTTGTEPLVVNFSDASSGASSWSWDFGDGGTSTAQNPSYTYNTAGTYSVALTVTNACGNNTSTRTNYITVNPCVNPTASFSGTPTSGTEPLTVSFTDGSSGASSWSWNFGDAATSTQQNPSHTYAAAGTYTVSLTATNSCGSHTSTMTNYITVNPCVNPTAGFSGTPTTGDYPLTVNFTDASSGASSWSWDFGDGGTSTAQNPSYTFTAAGTYSVAQTVTNACGSNSTTMTNYITVSTPPCNTPVASFSGTPTSGNSPLSVSFTDASTNSPTSWAWDFGDGGTSTAQNPTYSYTVAGTFTVAMTASNSCGSHTSTMTNYITVNSGPVTGEGFILSRNADFSTDDRTFSNNETMYVKMWTDQVDFNDINRARFELRNAAGDKVRTNLTNNFDNTYTGSFNMASLPTNDVNWDWKGEVKDNPGNRYKPTTAITVTAGPPPAPVADFSGNPTNGFAPLAVNFTDLSTNIPTAWSWDFGDGATSTVQNPSHSYASAGSYTVSLTATNAGGTNTNTKVNYITANVCTTPTAGFAGTPLSGDAPLAVSFTDQSTGATSWSWDFGDGGSSTAQNPNYTYASPGTYSVSLTASNSCGSNTSTMTNYITVNTPPCNSPVASFTGTPTTGNAPMTVSFTDQSSNTPTSWVWDFGDGGTSSVQNPSYTYSAAGIYSVSMTVTNACGTNTSVMTNYITVNAGGPVTGEGFILSRNADFSTDDRSFDNNEIMYVKMWSDVVDFNDINRARFEMKDANKNKTRINLTNNFDGTYTGQMDLLTLPSGAASWTWKGEAKDNQGNSYKPSTNVTINMVASNSVSGLLVETFGLRQNYPNPFNPTTSISFMLETASTVKLEVYNTQGQKVETLAKGHFNAGQHTFDFDASKLSSGVYLYRLTTDGKIETKKMLLLK